MLKIYRESITIFFFTGFHFVDWIILITAHLRSPVGSSVIAVGNGIKCLTFFFLKNCGSIFCNGFIIYRWTQWHLSCFLDWTVISTTVSVESTELHCCSSCKCSIPLLFCSLKVAMTLPRDWSSAEPVGAAPMASSTQPLTFGCPYWTKHKLAAGA